MLRVALYARYSDDQQRAASIEDQFRICRERAEREGWRIIAFYKDAAISGASVILRPGIQTLLQDALEGQFDLVLAEALDRISRDQADTATLFKHLRFAGVQIVTLAEGAVDELHVGLKGTMNALFLKDLAAKTHRGLRGRVERGKAGGGISYGYRAVRRLDSAGEFERGEREIVEAQAEVVRRIFREIAAGDSARAIAKRLNAEGIAGPNDALWQDTTIRGHVKRHTGLINNELYVGRMVWNRQRYIKDPRTGRRVARPNPESAWVITEAPHLRIVDDELWQAVKARQADVAVQYANVTEAVRQHHQSNRLHSFHRHKTLLSGLIFCGGCGGPYSLRAKDRFMCSAYVSTGTCTNGQSIGRADLEGRAIAGLKERLMAPEAAAEAMKAYAEETNRLNHARTAQTHADRAELARIQRTLKQMLQTIEDGGYTRGMIDRMREMEAREDELTAALQSAPEPVPDLHPRLAEIYRQKVARLAEALGRPEDQAEASAALRELIEKIVLTPGPKPGELQASLHGELGRLMAWTARQEGRGLNEKSPVAWATGDSLSVGAGTGFEPVTFRL